MMFDFLRTWKKGRRARARHPEGVDDERLRTAGYRQGARQSRCRHGGRHDRGAGESLVNIDTLRNVDIVMKDGTVLKKP